MIYKIWWPGVVLYPIWNGGGLNHSKAHIWLPIWLLWTPSFYLVPFSRYSISKFLGFDLDLWPLKVIWDQKSSYHSKAHIWLPIWLLWTPSLYLVPFSRYSISKFLGFDLDLWPLKVIRGPESLNHSKAHIWLPIWLLWTPSFYLVTFSRYSISKFLGFDLDLWPLKVIWDQKSLYHSKAHIWLPIWLLWTPSLYLVPFSRYSISKFLGFDLELWPLKVIWGQKSLNQSKAHIWLPIWLLWTPTLYLVPFSRYSISKFLGFDLDLWPLKVNWGQIFSYHSNTHIWLPIWLLWTPSFYLVPFSRYSISKFLWFDLDLWPLKVIWDRKSSYHSKAHIWLPIWLLWTPSLYLVPFSRYSISKFLEFDLDLWPLKVTWNQKSLYHSKAHIWLPNWLLWIPPFYLVPFSRYSISKFLEFDFDLWPLKVIWGPKLSYHSKAHIWLPIWLLWTPSLYLVPFSRYSISKFLGFDLDLWPLKVNWGQTSLYHSKAHIWFPIWLLWTPSLYLVPFSRYSISKFLRFDLDLWPLKVIRGQKSLYHSKAHIWLPFWLLWTPSLYLVPFSRYSISKFLGFDLDLWTLQVIWGQKSLYHSKAHIWLPFWLLWTPSLYLVPFSRYSISKFFGFDLDLRTLKVIWDQKSLYYSKAHIWLPFRLLWTPSFYLVPFSRYSISKFLGFDLDLWPLKVIWDQKSLNHSKAHISLPIWLLWTPSSYLVPFSRYSISKFSGFDLDLWLLKVIWGWITLYHSKAHIWLPFWLLWTPSLYLVPFSRYSISKFLGFDLDFWPLKVIWDQKSSTRPGSKHFLRRPRSKAVQNYPTRFLCS